MKAITVPAPLGTLLITRQPCSDHLYLTDCGQMVAQWITVPEPPPDGVIGSRVMFHQDGPMVKPESEADGWVGPYRKADGRTLLATDGTVLDLPLGCVVGSGVIAECLPIAHRMRPTLLYGFDVGQQRRFIDVAPEAGRLELFDQDAAPTRTDISDQLPFNDWTPGRWALRVEQAAPTTERCPAGCWAGKVPGHTRGSGWDWVPCAVCNGNASVPPFRVSGRALHEPHCNTKCSRAGHWLHDDDTGHAHDREVNDECAVCRRAGWWHLDPSMVTP